MIRYRCQKHLLTSSPSLSKAQFGSHIYCESLSFNRRLVQDVVLT